MVNIDLVLLLIFAIVLGIVMYFNRDKVKLEKIAFPLIYVLMYKTKIGLELMDKIAKKFPRFTAVFGFLGIIFGYLTMALIFVVLTVKVYDFLFNGTPTPIAPLLPGIQTVPGIPVLSFWHWIISIFILAGIHEFSHGLLARLHDIKLKSSGFAVLSVFLPVVPAAFVEPDEEQLNKRSKRQQLEVLAAGSFSNYVTAAIFLVLFLFVITPVFGSTIESEGVVIVGVYEDYPANLSGVVAGEEIWNVNGKNIQDIEDFFVSLEDVGPGDNVELTTNVSSYSIVTAEKPKDFMDKLAFWREERGYLGVVPSAITVDYKDGFKIIGKTLSWFSLLFYWIFTINLAVGMFNMLPLGPIDGGRMFYIAALFFVKDEKKAKKIWTFVSFFCLALIIVGLMPFILKLLGFVFGPLINLVF
jgi:membrane-associated protease RseP (regulator of RpoE activity)